MTSAATTTPRLRARRSLFWVVLAVVLVLIGAAGAALGSAADWAAKNRFDPESAGPLGARAIVQILRDQGIDVVIVRNHNEVANALQKDATLVLPDAPALSDDALQVMSENAAHLVLIEPRARTLDLFLPGSATAGAGSGELVAPECTLAEAERSGDVSLGVLLDPATSDAVGCYPEGDAWGLLQKAGERTITVFDGTHILTNESLASASNAALALNVIGGTDRVVWYMPSLGDTDLEASAQTLGDLTPLWVTPAIALLLLSGVVAAVWQGRRFGPLVAERLPVTVRAAETTEGRGRLYAASGDPLHAADQLRLMSLDRIAQTLGLGATARVDEISDAAAAITATDRRLVRDILVDSQPASNRELVDLASRLNRLEEAVRAAVSPERKPR